MGIFWPSIMKMRSQYIPEESRSTIMNFFRIPLNIFVCVVLYNVSVTVRRGGGERERGEEGRGDREEGGGKRERGKRESGERLEMG